MLLYFFIIIPTLFAAYLIFSYWQEVIFRRKPSYRLADVGWKQTTLPPEQEKIYSLATIGDIGALNTDGTDPVLKIFEDWQQKNQMNSTAIFLGDNLYPVGLPEKESSHFETAKARLDFLLDKLKKHATKGIFLSGNHDWDKGRKRGYQQMLRQEAYVINALQDESSFLPRNGCPGPVPVQLAENLLLLIINTQWWVHRGVKPLGKKYGCPYEDIEEFYEELKKVLHQNKHQRIIVAAHHPLYSNALHGGKFTVKQHLFPLTAANKRFLIPLPILGSLYPMYRKLFGAYEDMSHRKYKNMRKRLLRIFNRYSNIVYVAGHDHNLQHFEQGNNHYIVSGAGSKTSFVKKGGKATFTLESLGFFTFHYYKNGELWIEVLATSRSEAEGGETVVFRKRLDSVLMPKAEAGPVQFPSLW